MGWGHEAHRSSDRPAGAGSWPVAVAVAPPPGPGFGEAAAPDSPVAEFSRLAPASHSRPVEPTARQPLGGEDLAPAAPNLVAVLGARWGWWPLPGLCRPQLPTPAPPWPAGRRSGGGGARPPLPATAAGPAQVVRTPAPGPGAALPAAPPAGTGGVLVAPGPGFAGWAHGPLVATVPGGVLEPQSPGLESRHGG